MEQKAKAIKMNDEINRNYSNDKKYIVKRNIVKNRVAFFLDFVMFVVFSSV